MNTLHSNNVLNGKLPANSGIPVLLKTDNTYTQDTLTKTS